MAEVHSLQPARERTEVEKNLVEDVSATLEDQQAGSAIAGYVGIILYEDGTSRSFSYRPKMSEGDEGLRYMGRSLFWAWAEKALEKHHVYAEAYDAVVDHVEYYDG